MSKSHFFLPLPVCGSLQFCLAGSSHMSSLPFRIKDRLSCSLFEIASVTCTRASYVELASKFSINEDASCTCNIRNCLYLCTINSVLQRLNGEEWIRHLRVRLVTLVAGTNPNCRPLGITSLEKNKLIQMSDQIFAYQSICKNNHWGLHMLQEKCIDFFCCL